MVSLVGCSKKRGISSCRTTKQDACVYGYVKPHLFLLRCTYLSPCSSSRTTSMTTTRAAATEVAYPRAATMTTARAAAAELDAWRQRGDGMAAELNSEETAWWLQSSTAKPRHGSIIPRRRRGRAEVEKDVNIKNSLYTHSTVSDLSIYKHQNAKLTTR